MDESTANDYTQPELADPVTPASSNPTSSAPDSASGGLALTTGYSAATTRVSATVTRRRVIEKVRIGRRRPWWIWLLPVIPAIVAAIGFKDSANEPVVAETQISDASTTIAAQATVSTAESAVPDSAVSDATTSVATSTAGDTDTTANTASDTAAASSSVADITPTTEPVATTEPAQTTNKVRRDVLRATQSETRLSASHAAFSASGLADALSGTGPFTVFAPSNAAWNAVDPLVRDALLKPENKAALANVLRYHVVAASLDPAALNGEKTTLDGATLRLATSGTTATISGPNIDGAIEVPGTATDNGYVYLIDHLLLPPGFVAPGQTNEAGDAVAEDLTVYFGVAKADLDAAANAKIDRAVEILQALPKGSIVALVGHADTSGNADYNQQLSEQRVDAVTAALASELGAAGSNVTLTKDHRGSTEPAANKAKSRRVTIEIQKR